MSWHYNITFSCAAPDAGTVQARALFTAQEQRWVSCVAQGVSMACALDQRAALERASSDANRVQVRRLVEEVRASSPQVLQLCGP